MIIIEKCPICNTKLECIPNQEEFIIDWFCGGCGISWTLEDLEFEPIQRNLGDWLK